MWPAAQWMDWQKESTAVRRDRRVRLVVQFPGRRRGQRVARGHGRHARLLPRRRRAAGAGPQLRRVGNRRPPPAQSIILGYELWQRKFNGDPHIVGKTLRMSRRDTPPTVIGVMPPGVRFLPSPAAAKEPNYNVNALVDFWMPASRIRRAEATVWDVVGRLKDGVTPKQAQAELDDSRRARRRRPSATSRLHARVQSLTDELNATAARILLPLFGAAALVLLIACGNTAALLLVRGLQRQQEYAVRIALGVGRAGAVRPGRGREPAARRIRRCVRHRPRLRHRQAVQADWRPRDSAARCGDDRLAGARRPALASALFAAALAGLCPPSARRGSTRIECSRAADPRAAPGAASGGCCAA